MGKRQGQLKKKNVEARRKAYVEAMKKNAETAKHSDSMIKRVTLRGDRGTGHRLALRSVRDKN